MRHTENGDVGMCTCSNFALLTRQTNHRQNVSLEKKTIYSSAKCQFRKKRSIYLVKGHHLHGVGVAALGRRLGGHPESERQVGHGVQDHALQTKKVSKF